MATITPPPTIICAAEAIGPAGRSILRLHSEPNAHGDRREEEGDRVDAVKREAATALEHGDADETREQPRDLPQGRALSPRGPDASGPERHRRDHRRGDAGVDRPLRDGHETVAEDEEQHSDASRRHPLLRCWKRRATPAQDGEKEKARNDEARACHQERREDLERDPHREVGRAPDHVDRNERARDEDPVASGARAWRAGAVGPHDARQLNRSSRALQRVAAAELEARVASRSRPMSSDAGTGCENIG